MTDRYAALAREWLAEGHHEAIKRTHREEFTTNLAALLDRVAAAARAEELERIQALIPGVRLAYLGDSV